MRTQEEIVLERTNAEQELHNLELRKATLLVLIADLKREEALLTGQTVAEQPLFSGGVTQASSNKEKVALFRSLFRGREDVYPRRWDQPKTGRSGYSPACRNWYRDVCPKVTKPKSQCADCEHRDFWPVTDDVLHSHLAGRDIHIGSDKDFTIGVYPMLPDETCWFLAADFDKEAWQEDAKAFVETCDLHGVPVALERSRSGNGGHCWIFFSENVPAALARRLGAALLTQTMERRPEIGFASYDRFFPNQDTLPKGGFGNLIALPLQAKPRSNGNSVFVDRNDVPYQDQWAFLSSIRRISYQELETVVDALSDHDDVLGVRLPVTDENEDRPWAAPPSHFFKTPPVVGPLPEQITLVSGNQIYVPKADITPSLRNRLIRLAAFQNPEFYQAQALRMSTHDKPRIISCCEDYSQHLGLPRGCLDELLELFQSLNVNVAIRDERFAGNPLDVDFHGALQPEQQQAADSMLKYDTGVLAASTGFGKTVVAAYLIAKRQVNTLVVVHRRQLMDQWIEALSKFLAIPAKEIGQIGGGKRKPIGRIDVAMIQSLSADHQVDDIVATYGQVIVDECHHVSANSFEQVVRQAKARYVTGLSATVARRDGHHPIIFMQCGPVRYRVSDRKQAEKRPFDHKAIIRPTTFHLPAHLASQPQPPIQDVYAALAEDDTRNQLIINDVIAAVEAGQSPVVLTERREHLELLAGLLRQKVDNVLVMTGGMGKKQRRQLSEQMSAVPADQPRVLLATGRYLGEGFDDDRLDALFLALPISWRGTLTQYAGRLHRENAAKKHVFIYDYADLEVPTLVNMYKKRRKAYAGIGYEVVMSEKQDRPGQLALMGVAEG